MTEENKEQEAKKTVIIFGITSFLGSNLAEFLRKDYRVVGTYHKKKVKLPGILTVPCDVIKKEEVQLIVYTFKPDIVIYAAGMNSLLECSQSPEKSELINTSGLFNVAEYAQRFHAQIICFSSQNVFSGEDRCYMEMDIPDPDTDYGKNQSSAEFYIQKTSLNYLIFRCCHLYGRGILPGRENFFEILQRKFSEGDPINLDNTVHFGFLDVAYLGLIIKVCLEKKAANRLFQVSTPDIMTHFEFGKLYSKIFNENEKLLSRSHWVYPYERGQKSADQELYFQLDNNNIEGFLNVTMPTVEESLQFTFRRLNGKEEKKGHVKKQGGDGINFI